MPHRQKEAFGEDAGSAQDSPLPLCDWLGDTSPCGPGVASAAFRHTHSLNTCPEEHRSSSPPRAQLTTRCGNPGKVPMGSDCVFGSKERAL